MSIKRVLSLLLTIVIINPDNAVKAKDRVAKEAESE